MLISSSCNSFTVFFLGGSFHLPEVRAKWRYSIQHYTLSKQELTLQSTYLSIAPNHFTCLREAFGLYSWQTLGLGFSRLSLSVGIQTQITMPSLTTICYSWVLVNTFLKAMTISRNNFFCSFKITLYSFTGSTALRGQPAWVSSLPPLRVQETQFRFAALALRPCSRCPLHWLISVFTRCLFPTLSLNQDHHSETILFLKIHSLLSFTFFIKFPLQEDPFVRRYLKCHLFLW